MSVPASVVPEAHVPVLTAYVPLSFALQVIVGFEFVITSKGAELSVPAEPEALEIVTVGGVASAQASVIALTTFEKLS